MRRKYEKIRRAGGELAIITADSIERLEEYRTKTSSEFVLLSDEPCNVIKDYGLYNPAERNGISLPAVFIIDTAGIVKYAHVEGKFLRVWTRKLVKEVQKV